MRAKERIGMKMGNEPLLSRSEMRTALAVVAAVSLVSMASGRSCIVNAGTETYAQSTGYSQAQSVTMAARTTDARATDYANETRRRTSSPSAGRNLSTMPPGSILSFR